MMMKSTIASSWDVSESVYEDLDAPMPDVTDGSQSEVKVRPVPRPRSKIQPKSQYNNNNSTVDTADTTSNTTNAVSSQLSGYPADYKMPRPVRPPPRPPLSSNKYMTSNKPRVDGGNHYMTSISKPNSPVDSTKEVQSPTRPERPPLPSSYSRGSTMRLKPENCTDESQQSRCSYISSMQQPPVSPAVSEVNIFGTYTTHFKSATDESQQSKCSIQQPSVSPAVAKEEVTFCGSSSTTADSTEKAQSPTRPERPPLPSSRCSTMRVKPESGTDEGQQSKCSLQQPPVSPAVAIEEVTLCGTSYATSCTDESQQSYISSMQQLPVSPAVSEVNICGTYTTHFKSATDESQQSKCSIQQPPVSPAVAKEEVTFCGSSSTTADSTEKAQSSTRPERPPLPSSRCSTMRVKPESGTDEGQQSKCSLQQPPVSPAVAIEEVTLCGTSCATSCTDESQQSYISSMQQLPVSPAVSEVNICGIYTKVNRKSATDEIQESKCSIQQPPISPAVAKELNICRTYGTVNCKVPEKPELPPRHGQSSPKTLPPPPSFSPPHPPSNGEPLDTVYSELEHRPYLDVLPEDIEKMMTQEERPTVRYQKQEERPTLRYQNQEEKLTVRYQSGGRTFTLHQSTVESEDVIGMLRWLKRVSKTDLMDPSVYGLGIEEEIRSFSERAMNVRKALRLYNLLMMKRNESLRNIITEFTSISDSLDKLKKKGKTMDIAGGTTGAVGGVTAVLGIAFAPMTLGTSLIATAIGAGMVASAGGMGAHTAKANKKIVNRMAVEKLVYEYKGNIVDLENCLSYILSGMNELRMHDIARLQRAGAHADVLKVAHLSRSVFQNTMNKDSRTTVAHMGGGMSSERLLLAFAKDMDQYFTEKDGLKLKKSNKSRFSVRVRLLAENLQYELYHLNHMWEMFG